MGTRALLAAALMLVLFTACGGGSGGAGIDATGGLGAVDTVPIPGQGGPGAGGVVTGGGGAVGLRNGILVRFVQGADHLQVWVTEDKVIKKLIAIWEGRDVFTDFSAQVMKGSGTGDHNHHWTWHLNGAAPTVNIPAGALAFRGTIQEVEDRRDVLLAGSRQYELISPETVLTQLHDYR